MSRDAALLLVARLTSALTTLAVLSLVARLRGADDLGLVAVGLATGAILAVLTDAGSSSLLVREGARRPVEANQLFGAMLLLRLATVPLVLGGSGIVLSVAFGAVAPVVWLAAGGLVVQQLADLTRAVSLSRGRVGLLAAHSIIENLAWFAVIGFLLLAGSPLVVALTGGLLALAVSVAAGLGIARVALGVRPALPGAANARRLAQEAAPFALYMVLGTAYTRIDTILVGLLAPGSAIVAAGAYFASTRLVAAFEYLPEALSRSLLPELSRGFLTDPAGLRTVLRRAARFLLFAGIPIPFAMVVFGPWLMDVLFGERIGAFGWVLVGLAALVPLRFFGHLFGVTLTSGDAQWRRAAASAVALAAVAAIDVVLLPRFGIAAAIVGAAAATLIVVILYASGVARLVGSLSLVADASRALVAACVALVAGFAARSAVSDPLAAGVFAAVYLVAVGLMARASWTPSFGLGSTPR